MDYDFPEGPYKLFLSGDAEKFKSFPFLDVSRRIKMVREELLDHRIPFQSTMFENAEVFGTLKSLQHFFDVFQFAAVGSGSWGEAMDRLESLRGVGQGLKGGGLGHHYTNVQNAFSALVSDLFDTVEPFTQKREAPNVDRMMSARVYEVGGKFDTYLQHLNTTTSGLNALLKLNPAFARVMGDSSSDGGEGSGQGGQKVIPSGAGAAGKQNARIVSGNVQFGKGNAGARYDISKCMELVRTVMPKANRGNLGKQRPEAKVPRLWRGANVLGWAWMQVRHFLPAEDHQPPNGKRPAAVLRRTPEANREEESGSSAGAGPPDKAPRTKEPSTRPAPSSG